MIPEEIPALREKLILLTTGQFNGVKLYHDKFVNYPQRFKFNDKKVYNIWLKQVKELKQLKFEDILSVFPDLKEKLHLWNNCIDEKGEVKKRAKEMTVYLRNKRKLKQQEKRVRRNKKNQNQF